MKLAKVEITHFRCFDSLAIDLQEDVNVFVGVNGAGKSTILDAIAIGLWDIVAANGGGGARQRGWQGVTLKPSDIHVPSGAEPGSGRRSFVQIRNMAKEFYEVGQFRRESFDGEPIFIEWQDHIQFRPPRDFDYSHSQSNRLSMIYGYFEEVWRQIETTEATALIPLPVVAYYRAHRRLSVMPQLGDIFSLNLERHGAYSGALNAGDNYQAMCQWFYLRENQELREKVQHHNDPAFEFPDLRAVRQAIIRTIEGVSKVYFEDNPPRLKVELASGNGNSVQELEQLSDGYRNLLAVVLDFARRLAQANPDWENPLEAPGILLIDEVELHLHPRWQQTILPRLRTVFPNTQLIVTTHSPQVLTTVHRNNIFILRNQQLFAPSIGTYGTESKQALEEVLQTDSRPPGNENTEDIRRLFTLINQGELDEASALCQELMEKMDANEPALIEAQTIINNRLWERDLGL